MTKDSSRAARAVYAFNSANVEGWGLYSEAIMLPYLPDEGKLCSLLMRLMRAGRAYLDPELQMGKMTYEEARRVLREDCVLSEAMTKQELDRYTFRSPGQPELDPARERGLGRSRSPKTPLAFARTTVCV